MDRDSVIVGFEDSILRRIGCVFGPFIGHYSALVPVVPSGLYLLTVEALLFKMGRSVVIGHQVPRTNGRVERDDCLGKVTNQRAGIVCFCTRPLLQIEDEQETGI